MKVLILAAGYGSRLAADIQKDALQSPSGISPYTPLLSLPKALLPVGDRPLLSHWLQTLAQTKQFNPTEDIFIVTNELYIQQLHKWSRDSESHIPAEHIFSDGTRTNATRRGAIACLALWLDRFEIQDDDICVIASDTLFFDEDFNLKHILFTFHSLPPGQRALVLHYHDEETEKTGILELNADSIVTNFIEKPARHAITSRAACPAFYLYKASVLPRIKQYVAQCTSLAQRDAPGKLIEALHRQIVIRAYEISGRWDIGSLESYKLCSAAFSQQQQQQQQLAQSEQQQSDESSTSRRSWVTTDNYAAVGIAFGLGLVASMLLISGFNKSRRTAP